MTAKPLVSVCVPTWNGEEVLGRALASVCSQTVEDIEILVGIDVGDDDSVRVAREWAARDSRIEVLCHSKRIGWTRNVNSLLARCGAPFFCLVFHDDTVAEDYLETLLVPLEEAREAASAYCCVEQITDSERIEDRGRSYTGRTADRLLARLLGDRKGSPLRALTRRAHAGGLRLPEASMLGFHAQQAYLLGLIAAGPSIYVDEIKYHRIHLREGGLTDRWRTLDPGTIRSDLAAVSTAMLELIEQRVPGGDSRRAVETAVADLLRVLLRRAELASGARAPVDFERVSAARCRPETIPPEWSAEALELRRQAARLEARIGAGE